MQTEMAKTRDTSVLKIAADMLEENGWTDEAQTLRDRAKSEGRGLPGSIEMQGRRWFQRTYGNTYHTVRVLVDGVEVYVSDRTYGYGDSYRDTAWEWLGENGYLGANWRGVSQWNWADENGVILSASAEDVKRERDL